LEISCVLGGATSLVRGAMGDKFPKHIYHEIICIGALIAHHENDQWIVDAVGAPHIGDRSEGELIVGVCR
jgi:3'-5' exonuclease